MATHSSILAWKIPRTEKPGGLQSTGSQRAGHDWVTELSEPKTQKIFLKLKVIFQSKRTGFNIPKFKSYKIHNNEMIVTYSTGSPHISNPQLGFWVSPPPTPPNPQQLALNSVKCRFIKLSFIYSVSRRELILGSHLTLLLTSWDAVRSLTGHLEIPEVGLVTGRQPHSMRVDWNEPKGKWYWNALFVLCQD